MRLDAANFIKYFIVHPFSPHLNACDRTVALVASIALGILTLGICHLVCAVVFRNYTPFPPGTTTNATQVFNQVFPNSDKANLLHLEKMIKNLEARSNPDCKKKAALFQKALDLYKKANCPPHLECSQLQNQPSFAFGPNRESPAYFQEKLPSRVIQLESTPAFYDYRPTPGHDDYWVDFANTYLGGGCFNQGFVQEEIMVTEMPDFANFIAEFQDENRWCTIQTREGNSDFANLVLEGNPAPRLIKNAHRVFAMDINKTYGSKLSRLPYFQVIEAAEPLPSPQEVNILAIAAPKLAAASPDVQFHVNTLKDIFNTLVAGFTLVKKSARSHSLVIHSGRIGCGVFNNHPKAVFLLHCLAAQYLGVKIKLHGYSDEDHQSYFNTWAQLSFDLLGKSLEECLVGISNLLKEPQQEEDPWA